MIEQGNRLKSTFCEMPGVAHLLPQGEKDQMPPIVAHIGFKRLPCLIEVVLEAQA
ncbi:MAG: hypothetical protein ACRCUE_15415 [Bosea sp. (in: a-proteobacteria)]